MLETEGIPVAGVPQPWVKEVSGAVLFFVASRSLVRQTDSQASLRVWDSERRRSTCSSPTASRAEARMSPNRA